jgi:cytochrome b involved in lipid metabolism
MLMKACRILLALYVTGTSTGQITPTELATHNLPTADCWTAIGSQVYDITGFINGADGGHPNTQIYEACGKDGTFQGCV